MADKSSIEEMCDESLKRVEALTQTWDAVEAPGQEVTKVAVRAILGELHICYGLLSQLAEETKLS